MLDVNTGGEITHVGKKNDKRGAKGSFETNRMNRAEVRKQVETMAGLGVSNHIATILDIATIPSPGTINENSIRPQLQQMQKSGAGRIS